jgi:hypothetical protein
MRKPVTSDQRPATKRLRPYRPRGVLPKRRPGAPKGNLNALKGGRSSRQYKVLSQLLIDHPELEGVEDAGRIIGRLLPGVLRDDAAAHKNAVRRARRILAPYQPERFTERITKRLIVAVLKNQVKRS